MKLNIFTLKILTVHIFILLLTSTLSLTYGQDSNQNSIISQSLTQDLLFEQSNISVNDITTFYILDHGVHLNFDFNLKINEKSIVLINKGDVENLNNSPYFLFHTLDIGESKALVRVYLSYVENGERKTNNLDISFVKNNEWEIINTPL